MTTLHTMTTVEARKSFSELINRSAYGKERVTLTRHGKSLVAIIPIQDFELLEKLEDQIDVQDAIEALNEAKKKGTKTLEAFKSELDK